jgi:hypothetical protein
MPFSEETILGLLVVVMVVLKKIRDCQLSSVPQCIGGAIVEKISHCRCPSHERKLFMGKELLRRVKVVFGDSDLEQEAIQSPD